MIELLQERQNNKDISEQSDSNESQETTKTRQKSIEKIYCIHLFFVKQKIYTL